MENLAALEATSLPCLCLAAFLTGPPKVGVDGDCRSRCLLGSEELFLLELFDVR